MFTLLRSDEFDEWLLRLRDIKGRFRITARLAMAEQGHLGDCKSVGAGISEMRIHYGPGYRVYFARRHEAVYLLLIGGDKSTQTRDIERAKAIAARFFGREL